MDIYKYPELKMKGVVALGKVGSDYVYTAKRFDPQTGEQVETPEVGSIILARLENHIKQLQSQQALLDIAGQAAIQAQIDAVQMVINDCKAIL